MKKLLVVLIGTASLVALYLLTDIVMDLRLRHEAQAIKAGGYAATIAQIEPPATPESREAGRLILAAYDSVAAAADTLNRKKAEFRNIALADSVDYVDNPALFQEVLSRNASALVLMLKAAESPEITFPFKYDQGWAMSLENVPVSLQTGCQLMRIHTKACFAQGRTEQGLKTLRAEVRLLSAVKDNFLLMLLVRESQLRSAFAQVREYAPRLRPDALAALQSDIAATDAPGSFKLALETEMALTQQAIVANRGWPQGAIEPNRPVRNFALTLSPVRKLARRLNMSATRQQIEHADRPWYQSQPIWDRDSAKLRGAATGGHLGLALAVNARLFFIRMEQHRADKEITQLGLNALLYRAENGRLPHNLDMLGGQPLIDPFSGHPYIYRPSANGFLLYSLGRNMEDDNGERPKDVSWQATL